MNASKYARIFEAAAQLISADKIVEFFTEPLKKEFAIRHVLMPHPVKQPDKYMSDAALLRPELRLVGFEYRDEEFTDLCGWCSSKDAFGWRLVHGGTGRGKSRLMVELCAHLNGHTTGNDWIAGFINVEKFRDDQEAFDLLFDTTKPLLITLDYAERQPEIVTQLLKCSYKRAIDTPDRITRIALVARSSTDIWDQIFRSDKELHSLGRARLADFKLEPVTVSATVEAVFAAAFKSFSNHFRANHVPPEFDLSTLALNGGHPDIGLVHMLALLAVVAPSELNWQVNARPTQDELLEHLLGREIRFWTKAAKDMGLPPELCTEAVVGEAAALLTLASQQGAIVSAQEARTVLRFGALLADQSEAQLDQIVSVFRETYPGIGYVNGVAPDLLGDFLIMRQSG